MENQKNNRENTIDGNNGSDDDDRLLEEQGYKQELYRGIGYFSNFAFGFTEVAVIASISGVYGYGLSTGGPVVLIWLV